MLGARTGRIDDGLSTLDACDARVDAAWLRRCMGSSFRISLYTDVTMFGFAAVTINKHRYFVFAKDGLCGNLKASELVAAHPALVILEKAQVNEFAYRFLLGQRHGTVWAETRQLDLDQLLLNTGFKPNEPQATVVLQWMRDEGVIPVPGHVQVFAKNLHQTSTQEPR